MKNFITQKQTTNYIDPMTDYWDILIRKIKLELDRKDIKQKDFAKKAGISRQLINDMLNGRTGKNPSYHTVYNIARVMGITTEELLDLPPLKKENIREAHKAIREYEIDDLLEELQRRGFSQKVIAIFKLLHLKETLDEEALDAIAVLIDKS